MLVNSHQIFYNTAFTSRPVSKSKDVSTKTRLKAPKVIEVREIRNFIDDLQEKLEPETRKILEDIYGSFEIIKASDVRVVPDAYISETNAAYAFILSSVAVLFA